MNNDSICSCLRFQGCEVKYNDIVDGKNTSVENAKQTVDSNSEYYPVYEAYGTDMILAFCNIKTDHISKIRCRDGLMMIYEIYASNDAYENAANIMYSLETYTGNTLNSTEYSGLYEIIPREGVTFSKTFYYASKLTYEFSDVLICGIGDPFYPAEEYPSVENVDNLCLGKDAEGNIIAVYENGNRQDECNNSLICDNFSSENQNITYDAIDGVEDIDTLSSTDANHSTMTESGEDVVFTSLDARCTAYYFSSTDEPGKYVLQNDNDEIMGYYFTDETTVCDIDHAEIALKSQYDKYPDPRWSFEESNGLGRAYDNGQVVIVYSLD
ncbi:MAG: hypothetical protein KBT19_05850 [Lachnospiraceae bacterium]|nr:hypothetical protein [Candidatus Colinaster equi]